MCHENLNRDVVTRRGAYTYIYVHMYAIVVLRFILVTSHHTITTCVQYQFALPTQTEQASLKASELNLQAIKPLVSYICRVVKITFE